MRSLRTRAGDEEPTRLMTGDDGGTPGADRDSAPVRAERAERAERDARFEREVLAHLDSVYRAASGVTGDPADAEELVMEVFTRAYAAFPRVVDGVDHKAWLYDLLASAFVGPHPEVCVLPPESGISEGLRVSALDEFVLIPESDVRGALLALPKEQRFAVYLAAVEGFTYHQIADIMDVSSAIAAYWLHDARLRLWAAEGPRVAASEEEYVAGGLVGAGRSGSA
ncbi:sigma factor-like helix-turn-helix DNA-binding protein [Streptomyces sp. NPDC026673]|uniref:sigma factor-like helix-turn-helix DNA-binding protein n=1 Tax=Streptomyces sp. NPDC026673 TaxID=3155724 RepID=UPI0033E2959F